MLGEVRSRIVFLIYHGVGHYNACFRLARILARDADVTFAGVPFFKQYVTSQGFIFYPLNTVPFGTGLEQWRNEVKKKKNSYFTTLKDRWTDQLYREREKELTVLLDELRPSLIFLDAQQATDFIVLYNLLKERGIRLALLHTMFPTTLTTQSPPLTSLLTDEDPQAIQTANQHVRNKNFRTRLLQKIKFLGADDRFIIRRREVGNKILTTYLQREESSFGYTLANIPSLILTPRLFDFRNASRETNQHDIGLCIDFDRIENVNPVFDSRKDSIIDEMGSQKLKLIYCGFGSIPKDNQALVLELVKKIMEAVREKPYLLLVSLNLDTEILFTLQQKHVHVFQQLPQLEILDNADLFITHGGLNSIKESIALSVPLLVYPIESKTDHFGNASRVAYHSIGLTGDARTDTVANIQDKISTLLSDGSFLKNLYAMSQPEKEMDDEKLISIIHALPKLK